MDVERGDGFLEVVGGVGGVVGAASQFGLVVALIEGVGQRGEGRPPLRFAPGRRITLIVRRQLHIALISIHYH